MADMKTFLQKHVIIIFLGLTTVQSIFNNLVHPVTPAFIHQLGLHDYVFGLAYASMSLSMFIFSFYWADASNKMKMNKILLISLLGYALSQFIFMQSTNEISIVGARLLAGGFSGGFMVGQMNFLVDQSSPEQRGRVLTTYTILMIVASTMGYFIGGMLGDISITLPFILQVISLIAIGLIYYLFLAQVQGEVIVHSKKVSIKESFTHSLSSLDGLGKALMASIFFVALSNTAFDNSFNYYIRDVLLYPPSMNGSLKGIIGLFTLFSNLTLTFYIIRRTKVTRSIQIILAVMVLVFTLLFIQKQEILFLGLSLVLLGGFSMLQPIQQQLVSSLQKDSESTHHLMGFYNAIKSLAGIIASLLAGFIYEIHVFGPFLFSLLSILIASGFIFFINRRQI